MKFHKFYRKKSFSVTCRPTSPHSKGIKGIMSPKQLFKLRTRRIFSPDSMNEGKSLFQLIWFYRQYEWELQKLFQFPLLRATAWKMFRQTQYVFHHFSYLIIFVSDCTFNVEIIKGPRGLGLSVSGGIDSSAPYPGLVRIKRLFPHQAAWATGKLQPGDILLEANGIILSGLTNNVSWDSAKVTEKLWTFES